MKKMYLLFCMLCFSLSALSESLLIISDDPIPALIKQKEKAEWERIYIVVPTDKIAKDVRKKCREESKIAVFSVPLFSHSMRFKLYSLDKEARKISLVPENGARFLMIQKCLSLDDFCEKANVPIGTSLVINWGNTGYFILRYADVSRFSEIEIQGLSPSYEKRMDCYLRDF